MIVKKLDEINKTLDEILDEIYTLAKSDGLTEAYGFIMAEAKQAIKQDLMGMPELQSEWEEDLRGTPNPNGIARNELRAELRKALEEYTK